MEAFAAYGGLFTSAFLAATLLPGSSEAVLAGLLLAGREDPTLLLVTATVGNVAGSAVNWVCGRFLVVFQDRWWFPVPRRRYQDAVGWFNRYGRWSLLFAWAPVVGDPLTVIAGSLKTPFPLFLVLVTIGKFARYLVVAAVAYAWTG